MGLHVTLMVVFVVSRVILAAHFSFARVFSACLKVVL